ncbi:hypothetical protein [Nocardiopsis aegyptia]|uniref:Uncharacterized protein n=1 Tax=Nocardiopsis aegyptia TaxID=220378 RepID=A0A7Z0ERC1_9ACTN|nr:hypothetical protein [Nocardiopsis aegyptia]NYJ36860.1 hypothetical protein [Nocardiopsis aegyptia]
MDAPSTNPSSARPRSRPGSRRSRIALTVLTVLCVLTALFAVSAYVGLDPGDSQVGLRAGVAFHYPLLIVHIVTSTIALLALSSSGPRCGARAPTGSSAGSACSPVSCPARCPAWAWPC